MTEFNVILSSSYLQSTFLLNEKESRVEFKKKNRFSHPNNSNMEDGEGTVTTEKILVVRIPRKNKIPNWEIVSLTQKISR